jgi:hypothetical protein
MAVPTSQFTIQTARAAFNGQIGPVLIVRVVALVLVLDFLSPSNGGAVTEGSRMAEFHLNGSQGLAIPSKTAKNTPFPHNLLPIRHLRYISRFSGPSRAKKRGLIWFNLL